MSLSKSSLTRFETEKVVINIPDLRALMGYYGLDENQQDQLGTLREQAAIGGRWQSYKGVLSPQALRSYELTHAAASVLSFNPSGLPELLRTPNYARELVTRALGEEPHEELTERLLELLAARQELFTRKDPPKFHAVISEDALKALAEGIDTEVIAEQLAHLVEMAGPDQPNTTVQVIRLVHAVPALRRGADQLGGVSDFTLLEFADPADPGGFYGPDNLFRDGPDFSELLDHFGRISRSALSPDESVLFLKNRLEALNRSTGSPSTGQGRRSAPGLPTSHASGHPLGAPTPRTRQGPRDGRRRGPSA